MKSKRRDRHYFKTGDRVQYTAKFLRSIMAYTGPTAHRKGTVRRIDLRGKRGPQHDIVVVKWDGEPQTSRVLATNLKHIGAWEPN